MPVAARLSAVLLALLVLFVVVIRLSGQPASASDDTFTDFLFPGWNLIGWVEEQTDVEEVFDAIPQLVSIHDGTGTAARRDDLVLVDFSALQPGRGYWFKVESDWPVGWKRSSQPASRLIDLQAGEQLVAWTGLDEMPISNALIGIHDQLTVAWHWDAPNQRFTPWAPNTELPGVKHQLVNYGDGMLLRLEDALQWLQTPGLLPKIIAPSGLLDRHLQTIKADIRAVEANFAREFKASIDQTRVSIFIEGSAHWDPFIPCCEPEVGWPERTLDDQGHAQYRFAIPLTAWTSQSWVSTARTFTYGYQQLLTYYFKILQHEYAREAIDTVPKWIVHGTTVQIYEFAGQRTRYSPALEFDSNQLILPLSSMSTPDDKALGRAYVSRLVAQSTPDAYFLFWSLMDLSGPSEDIWKRSFRLAFGLEGEEFVQQVNRERGEAFTTLTGSVLWEGAPAPSAMQISAWVVKPFGRGPLPSKRLANGTYRLNMPRDSSYRLELEVPVRGCRAHVGTDGQVSARRDAVLLEAGGQQDEGPTVTIPAEFCQHQLNVVVTGPGVDELRGIRLQRCTPDGETCSYWRTNFLGHNVGYRGRVPLPGRYVLRINSLNQTCPAYLTEHGVTSDPALALQIEATNAPIETVVELAEGIQLCQHTLSGQFTGKPSEWYAQRNLRLSHQAGGGSVDATLDDEGNFEALVPSPGNYRLSISVFRPTDGGVLSCSISSEQENQWLRRVSNPPQVDENYALVSSEDDSELQWEINPSACELVVSGRAQSPEGEPLAWASLIACPQGGGLCENFDTDRHGRFQYLADAAWRYYVTTRLARSAHGLCQQGHRLASTSYFAVRLDSANQFTWTFPPSPCE